MQEGGGAMTRRHGHTRHVNGKQLPFCRLHRRMILDGLPVDCPLNEKTALEAIDHLRTEAWARLAPGPNRDLDGGLTDLDRADICCECALRLLKHPHIKRLREQATAEMGGGRRVKSAASESTGRIAIRTRRARPARKGGAA